MRRPHIPFPACLGRQGSRLAGMQRTNATMVPLHLAKIQQRRPRIFCRSIPAKTHRRTKPRSTFVTALTLLAISWHCRHSASALPTPQGASPASRLTLRVRMPDGAVQRVQATASETVDDIMRRLGMDGGEGGEGLSTGGSAGSPAAEGSASIAALGLRNGDFLYVKVRTRPFWFTGEEDVLRVLRV